MFSPDEAVSRWQMALFLNRMFGLIGDNTWPNQDGFTDTAHLRAEFRQAIGWLANTGITTGVGPGLFDPEGVVTRWQMALFLKRFAEHLGVDKAWANLDGFTDTGHLRDEFRQAIGWLATTEITTGVGPGLFDPDGVVTRSQMVTFLHRLATYLNSALTPDP
jgi:alpha-amylase